MPESLHEHVAGGLIEHGMDERKDSFQEMQFRLHLDSPARSMLDRIGPAQAIDGLATIYVSGHFGGVTGLRSAAAVGNAICPTTVAHNRARSSSDHERPQPVFT
jgi:hypothetical protein